MQILQEKTRNLFVHQFGYHPTIFIQAPGRVNLIGEHTDYNDGFVLPCAIDYQTVISCHPRTDNMVNVVAADYDSQRDHFSLSEPLLAHSTYQWANYVRGVFKYVQQVAPDIGGVDLVVSGNVPQGAGLSSSASLEVAVAKMLQVLNQLPLTGSQLALIGQAAENKFVGCNCGIMDQLISALGEPQHALLIDCRSLATQAVALPADAAIVIINSNVQRGLVGSEYNTRRLQCEAAATALGVKALRDATLTDLAKLRGKVDPVVIARARHVISENDRTQAAAKALAVGDYAALSHLMAQSHQSMRDDFAITVPPIDYLVDIVHQTLGDSGGVRMTGGGFGGCVVALVPQDKVEQVRQTVAHNYFSHSGINETIYICSASAGAGQCR